ncbi:lipopolysaccharide biosynthesis protein [Sphingomonas qomolangmaensis]|uniref:Lipopolysaccharide biosynthesis protein n=1 Tax=Sphingomonas qomolangmaensis TaxID=2918765 RepID=A0ABY5L5Y8_9SPHN|nr:lipopolysaccharide biosynthesis protein [Sphingomonas qomolangmaensis]UUL82374.1 lipopolysaccharide biosynthesis protein [Sphingomonas qomolangmaensis]
MTDPPSPKPLQLGRLALQGGLVTGLAQALKMALSLVSVVVLARLLAPQDFGLVASIAPIVAFIALFQDLGLQAAIIQRETITREHLNQTFWISPAIASVAALLIIAAAPLAALFYNDQRVTAIMVVAAVPIFIGSLATLPLSLLNRNMRFGNLALNDVLVAATGFGATVGAALLGSGYWSLVIGPIAAALTAVIAAWIASPWRPGRPTLKLDGDLWSFGANLTGFNIVNFLARNFDNVLIGRVSGMTQLGLYDRSYKLLLFPLQNISQPLSRVMIPILSRVQNDKARFRKIYLQTNMVLGFCLIPGIAAATLASDQLINLLFGPEWSAAAPIFAWLGIASLAQVVLVTNGWIFICQGKTRAMFRLGLWTSGVTVIAFLVGIQWGVVGLAAAYTISAYLFRIPALIAVLHRIGPVTASDMSGLLLVHLLPAALSAAIIWAANLEAWELSDVVSIGICVVLNYCLATLSVAIFPPARSAMVEVVGRLANLRRRQVV